MESLVHCLHRQKLIQHRTLTLHLSEGSGRMRFGSGFSKWWTAKLETVGVDRSWAVQLAGISLLRSRGSNNSSNSNGRSSLQNMIDKPTQVLLDSGSQGLRGPSVSIEALAEAIGADRRGPGHHFRVPCSQLSSLPSLVLELPMAAHRQLHGKDRNMPRIKAVSSSSRRTALGVVLSAESLVANSTGEWCTLQLRSNGVEGPWVLGEVFFRKMHAVAFDFVTQGIVIDPLEHAAVLVDHSQPQVQSEIKLRTLLRTKALTET